MGQCPSAIPKDEETLSNRGSMGLLIDVLTCSPTAKKYNVDVTSEQDPTQFIVGHTYDGASLIPKEQLEKVFERELLLKDTRDLMTRENNDDETTDNNIIINNNNNKVDDDDRKSDYTTITTKVRNTDKYRYKEHQHQHQHIQIQIQSKRSKTQTIVEEYMEQERISTSASTSTSTNEANANANANANRTDSNLNCGACLVPAEYEHHIPEENTLHLTKKAHMAKFYRRKYLTRNLSNSDLDLHSANANENVPHLVLAQSQSHESENTPSSRSTTTSDLHLLSDYVDVDVDPIKLRSDGSSFLDLVMQGSLGLAKRARENYGRPSSSPSSPASSSVRKMRSASFSQSRLYLLDQKTDKLIAMCCLCLMNRTPVVTVYSPSPKSEGQYPAANVSYKGKRLYRWAEITAEGEFPFPVQYSIYLTDYRDTMEKEPRYRASNVQFGNPNIKVVGKTECEYKSAGCCLISIEPSPDTSTSTSTSLQDNNDHDSGNFSIKVARGVDPALFLCLTAFADELLEYTMRRAVAERENDKLRLDTPEN